MNGKILNLTALLGSLALAGLASSASADTITINFDGLSPPGGPLTIGDFQFDDTRLVNGNCDSASGPPCEAFNNNETSTLSRVSGGTFSLDSFWFQLLGNGTDNTLFVTSDLGVVYNFNEASPLYDNNDGGHVVSNPADFNFTDVHWITFSKSFGGNVRVDDFALVFEPSCHDDCDGTSVPEPGTLALLGLGLFGLGFNKRRKLN
jgi:hypothetical protein